MKLQNQFWKQNLLENKELEQETEAAKTEDSVPETESAESAELDPPKKELRLLQEQ